MPVSLARRALLRASLGLIPLSLTDTLLAGQSSLPEASVPDGFPTYSAPLVRETVWVAHYDQQRVRQLVEARPALARASWDWGFGDFETALGAASHMGNRPIAEYLIGKGARPSLFSAAMLGQIDVVKAFLTAEPGAQRIRGPHGIGLLAHARMGGAAARGVAEFLSSLDGADDDPTVPLGADDAAALPGMYVFGITSAEQVRIDADVSQYRTSQAYSHPPQLNWTRTGTVPRPLFHVGNRTFYPAGAPAVRIRFAAEGDEIVMTVQDPDLVLRAVRKAKL